MPSLDEFACLYVIEIDTRGKRSRIKIGYTCQPQLRLKTHRAVALAHGCKPGREYASPAGSGAPSLEDELVAFCCAQPGARQFCREYFTRVDFTAAARFTAHLCQDERSLREWRLTEFQSAVRLEAEPERLACSVEEAARWLSTTEATVQGWIDSGTLRAIRLNGRVLRLQISALEDLLFQDQEPIPVP